MLPVSMLDLEAGMENEGNWFCYKDSHDYLWMSSFAGLHRYDGKNIQVFRPDPNDSTSIYGKQVVTDFFEDTEQNLWFGTELGLNCFIRSKSHFKWFEINEGDIGEYRVRGIDDAGLIWLTFDDHIYLFNPIDHSFQQKAKIQLHDLRDQSVVRLSRIVKNKNGEVKYFLSFGSYDDHPGMEFHHFEEDQMIDSDILFLNDHMPTLVIRDIYAISDEVILIAALEGLYRFHLKQKILHKVWPKDDAYKPECTGVVPFSDSTFLITTKQSELLEINLETERIMERYRVDDHGQTIIDYPAYMMTDRDGGIYIHIERKGIAFFHPSNLLFKHRAYTIEVTNKPTSIILRGLVETREGNILGTSHLYGGFLFSKKGQVLKTFHTSSPQPFKLNHNRISLPFKTSQDQIWMLCRDGYFARFADPELSSIRTYWDSLKFRKITEIDSGYVALIPKGKGLIRAYYDEQQGLIRERIAPLDSFIFSNIGRIHDGLLLANIDFTKLALIDPHNDFRIIKEWPFENGFFHLLPIKGQNEVLIASDNGPYHLNLENDSLSLIDFSKIGREAMIFCFIPLGNQEYLMSSDRGVATINLGNKTSRQYDWAHGLGMERFNAYAHLQDSESKIWLGNNSGVTWCDPDHLEIPEFINRVNITDIQINDNPAQTTTLLENIDVVNDQVSHLELNYRHNTISFDFAAFSYLGVDHHEYEFRLSGQSDAWIDGGNRGNARYTNISPGDYTFQVRVKNRPVSMREVGIGIIPPLWGRLWFQVMISLLLLAGFYSLFILREKRKRRIQQLKFDRRLALEQERVRIATDMHDDVGSGLSALNIRANVLANQEQDPEMKKQLNLLAQNSKKLTQKIREIIWTVNAQNDTLENLITRLHQYALEFFEHTGIRCNVELMEQQTDLPINGYHRREIYLTYKEALNNIYKHAKASEVYIKIEMPTSSQLSICIQDNGRGFDPTVIHQNGHGLSSMKNRIESLGGQFTIKSTLGLTEVNMCIAMS